MQARGGVFLNDKMVAARGRLLPFRFGSAREMALAAVLFERHHRPGNFDLGSDVSANLHAGPKILRFIRLGGTF